MLSSAQVAVRAEVCGCGVPCRRAKTAGTKTSVATVAKSRPPMTARPSGAFCSPPSPSPSAMGIMPMIMARAVMMTGRKRVAPASTAARMASPWCCEAVFGEGDDEDAVGGGDAHAHDRAHERGNAERGVGEEEEEHDAGERGGQRGDDDEGIEPGLEVDDDEQVDEDDGEDEAGEEADVGVLHGLDLAAERDEGAAGQIFLFAVDDLVDLAADGAEVAALHVAVDVDDAADVVVGDDGHLGAARDGGDVAEDLRALASPAAGGDGECSADPERLDVVLRGLGDHVVVDAVLRVEEEHGRDLEAAAEGVQHAAGDVAAGVAALLGLGAIDVDVQRSG